MKEIAILGGLRRLRALHVLQKSGADIHISLVDRNDYHYGINKSSWSCSCTQPDEKFAIV